MTQRRLSITSDEPMTWGELKCYLAKVSDDTCIVINANEGEYYGDIRRLELNGSKEAGIVLHI